MKKLFFAKVLSKILLTFATKTPITAVASSGPEDPAAMKVAPATSGGKFNTTKMTHIYVLLRFYNVQEKPTGGPAKSRLK